MKSWRSWDRRSEPEKFKDATGYEECPDFDPAEVSEALQNPDKSHIDEMISVVEQAEREYVAQGEPTQEDSFSICQLKRGDETLDYRFEPLDVIRRNGLSVDPANYELVYTAPLTAKDNPESIYTPYLLFFPLPILQSKWGIWVSLRKKYSKK